MPGGEPGIFCFFGYFLSLKQRLRPRLLRPHKSREEFKKPLFLFFSLSLLLQSPYSFITSFLTIYENEEFCCLKFIIRLSTPSTWFLVSCSTLNFHHQRLFQESWRTVFKSVDGILVRDVDETMRPCRRRRRRRQIRHEEQVCVTGPVQQWVPLKANQAKPTWLMARIVFLNGLPWIVLLN